MFISGKIHLVVIFLFLIDDGFWVWHSRVSNPELNSISFHGIGRTMNCVCIWSQYWLRFVQTTTVACRASFLISCLHDQPRSTANNHDQHGRSGGVTLYDQQESHPACGPCARLASNGGGYSRQHCRLNVWRYIGWVDKYSIRSQDPIAPLIVDQARGWHQTWGDEDWGILRETFLLYSVIGCKGAQLVRYNRKCIGSAALG